MSGWNSETLEYELTPTKASYYWRMNWQCPDDIDPVTFRLRQVGFRVREKVYIPVKNKSGGYRTRVMPADKSYPRRICSWLVQATVGQIWEALSGGVSGDLPYHTEGKAELIAAGLYVDLGLKEGAV